MQLTLPVTLPINQTFESYFSEGHTDVVAHLKGVLTGETDTSIPLTLLTGAEGTGKSHLLFSLCHLADSHRKSCVYISLSKLDTLEPAVFEGMEQHDILCIDNVDAIAENEKWERALFDLINKVTEKNSRGETTLLVLTSRQSPKHAKYGLPDLISRLQWGVMFKLSVPNDEQRRHIVALRAKQKGLSLSDSACSFLLSHSNRHLPVLMDIIDELDALSLQAQKKITVPMLKKVLE